MSKKMTPIRKTFDRAYDLFKESPPSLALPWGFNLVRFVSVRSNQHVPLVLLHVSEAVAGDDGEALCGESGTVGEDMIGLSANTRYQFCRPCQEAGSHALHIGCIEGGRMSKKKEGVYLAELDVYGYALTAVGKTKAEATKAVRDSYYEGGKKSGLGCPRDDYGKERSFKNYAEYACFHVHYLPFGECDWL